MGPRAKLRDRAAEDSGPDAAPTRVGRAAPSGRCGGEVIVSRGEIPPNREGKAGFLLTAQSYVKRQ